MRKAVFGWGVGAVTVLGAWAAACGSGPPGSGFDTATGAGPHQTEVDAGTTEPPPGALMPDASGGAGCVNLQCKQVSCSDGKKTTVSGFVLDPGGQHALYNVIVYVPNAPVTPFASTVSCDRCGALTSGSPVVSTLTKPDGTFILENVPVGRDIPLVLQLGKWRKQISIPQVTACADTRMADANTMRLPRDKQEGDIPQIAIATGQLDPMECLLRKIGIAESEFTRPNQDGRVHLYRENGADLEGWPGTQAARNLYLDPKRLEKYDVVILPCEGAPNAKTDAAKKNLLDYTAAGGRVFTTHFGYVWIKDAPAPFSTVASWRPDGGTLSANRLTGDVDTSFPKGADFADWLVAVDAGATRGKLEINDVRWNLDAENAPARRWVTTPAPDQTVQHITFNTPVGAPDAQQCGRVVYSNFHVAGGGFAGGEGIFPLSCPISNKMTPQEKALEFMLFDLTSCIQKDDESPRPPPPR